MGCRGTDPPGAPRRPRIVGGRPAGPSVPRPGAPRQPPPGAPVLRAAGRRSTRAVLGAIAGHRPVGGEPAGVRVARRCSPPADLVGREGGGPVDTGLPSVTCRRCGVRPSTATSGPAGRGCTAGGRWPAPRCRWVTAPDDPPGGRSPPSRGVVPSRWIRPSTPKGLRGPLEGFSGGGAPRMATGVSAGGGRGAGGRNAPPVAAPGRAVPGPSGVSPWWLDREGRGVHPDGPPVRGCAGGARRRSCDGPTR